MELLRGDAHLAAEAELAPVGKARGGIDIGRSAVRAVDKALGARGVLGDDGIAVVRRVGEDVRDGGIQTVHHADGENVVEILGVKVLLARALFGKPDILLLDEPTSSLDIRNQYQVLQITRDLCREQDLTAMIVIHDLNLALRFCDRFLLLREGEVYRYGGAEIFDADALRDVYGVKGSIVQVQGQSLVLIDDEEKEKLS